MKLSNLLDRTRTGIQQDISELKFKELLNDTCKNSYPIVKRAPIFVQLDSKHDFFLVTPSKKEVKSSFWIDHLVGESMGWKRYPSRERFIKGYSTIDQSDQFGQTYVIIPVDHTRVGICSKESFYKSFDSVQKDLDISRVDNPNLSNWLAKIQSGLNKLDEKFKVSGTVEKYSMFISELHKIDLYLVNKVNDLRRKVKSTDELNDQETILLTDLFTNYITTCKSYLIDKLDPEANGFSVCKVESFYQYPGEHELWLDGRCLMIKRSKYIELHKQGILK